MAFHLIELSGPPPQRCGERRVVESGSTRIALFAADGALYALEDACVRCAAPLSAGPVADGRIACPECGWRYDLSTGASEQVPQLEVHTFRLRVEGSRVLIEWPGSGG